MKSSLFSKMTILLLGFLLACQPQPPTELASPVTTETVINDAATNSPITPIPATHTSESQSISPDNVGQLDLRTMNLGKINKMVYSSDGDWLYVLSNAGIFAYETKFYQEVMQVSPRRNASISSDAKIFVDWRGTSVFSSDSGQKLVDLEMPINSTDSALMRDAVFSDDGSLIAQHYYDTDINKWLIWRLNDGTLLNEFRADLVEISPNNRLVAVQLDIQDVPGADPNAHVFLFDLETGGLLSDWRANRPVFLSDNSLVVESGGSIKIIDTQTLQTRMRIAGSFAAFSADEHLVAVLQNDNINLHRVADGQLLRELHPGLSSLDDAYMEFSADGQVIAARLRDLECCGGYTDHLLLWRVADGGLIADLIPGSFLLSRDGQTLLTNGQIVRTSNGSRIAELRPAFIGAVTNLAFTHEGQEIIVASYDDLYVYQVNHEPVWLPETADPETYEPILLKASPYASYGVIDIQKTESILSPDGMVSAQLGNGQAVLVSPSGGTRFIIPVENVTRIAFSADGQLLAVGQLNGSVELWNVQHKAKVFAIPPLNDTFSSVGGLAFSPDGSLLAIGSDDGIVRLYSIGGK